MQYFSRICFDDLWIYRQDTSLSWQIAVDRNSEKGQYKIDYPLIDVFYMEPKILDVE